MVPNLYGISSFSSAKTCLTTRSSVSWVRWSSLTWLTSGIMISGLTSTFFFFSEMAASTMARTCISMISG